MRIALTVPRPDFLQPDFSGDHSILPAIRSGLTERGHDVEVASYLDAREAGRGNIPVHRVLRDPPIVAMRTGSTEATVEDGRTGLLAANLPEFRARLAELFSDRPRCDAMGRAAREYVTRHHSLDVRVRQLEDALLGRVHESERGSGKEHLTMEGPYNDD